MRKLSKTRGSFSRRRPARKLSKKRGFKDKFDEASRKCSLVGHWPLQPVPRDPGKSLRFTYEALSYGRGVSADGITSREKVILYFG